MKRTRRRVQIWRGLTTLFSSLFTILLCISLIMNSYTKELNTFLGASSTRVTNLSNESSEDLQYYESDYDSIEEMLEAKGKLSEQITDEGIVLVKNNGVLPLTDAKMVTCLGRSSTDLVYAGGSGAGIIGNVGTSINADLKIGLERAGFVINPIMWDFYKNSGYAASYGGMGAGGGFNTGEVPVSEYPAEKGYEEFGDACIVVIARNAGESNDGPIGEYEDGAVFYQLTEKEKAILEEAKSNFENVIVIVNSPSALSIEELKEDDGIDAVLIAGGLGMNGAYSLGSILNGTVNPSGHLTDTYAVDSLSSPAIQNQGDFTYSNEDVLLKATENGVSEYNTKYLVQTEGIYIGYKYYETRYEDCVLNQGNASSKAGAFASKDKWNYPEEISYSMGYGMSYTTFSQEVQNCTVENDVIKMTIKVTNTGDIAGKDVVQLYAQSPYTEYDEANKVEKSSIQLVNFAKTNVLNPGESEEITIKMDLYNICSYDYTNAKTWILDNGMYYFAIGDSAHDALNNILAAKGKTISDGMDYAGNSAKSYAWENKEFRTFEQPKFSEDGFNTYADTYHTTTDTKVTNLLDDGDLNTWIEDGVTYLTRSDWEKSWPVPYEGLTATDDMMKHLNAEVYEPGDKDTSSITTGADTDYQVSMMKGKTYEDEGWNLILNQLTLKDMMSLVGKNFSATDPIPSISYPGTIDNDGPAGVVTNYSSKYDNGSTIYEGITNYSNINPRMYPSQSLLACAFNQELAYQMGEMFGEDSLYTGQTAIWAPGLNLHRSPYSGRNFEYFSEDSMITYILGAQQVAGMQTKGAVACPKHYAFNDYEINRFGLSVFMTEQTARENGLRGFEGAMAVGHAKNVMTGLNRIGCDWIGMNSNIQNALLRGEWGFDGYVITDNAIMPYMYGYAVTYGTDKFLVFQPGRYEVQLSQKVTSKDLTLLTGLREACHRILYVNVNSNMMNGLSDNIKVEKVLPPWKKTVIGVDAVMASLSILFLGMFIRAVMKKRREI